MSPIKFEENIKKELENRTIPVSNEAWESLSKRLEAENPKRASYWWVGVAASFIIILIVTFQFVNKTTEAPSTIVTTPEIEETLPKENKINQFEQNQNLIVEGESEPINSSEINQDIKEVEVKKGQDVQLISSAGLEIKEIEITVFEDQKVEEIVAQIVELKKENNTVTDAEIEDLLMEAQNEIEMQKLMNGTSPALNAQTVNADLLLYEVESEINKSFRDKVFKELEIKFKSIKTAVAQRND